MTEKEIRLDRYVIAVWKARWIILVLMLLTGGITYWLITRQPAQITSTALIKVGKVNDKQIEDPYVTAELINSLAFHHAVSEKHGGDIRPNALRRAVRADTVNVGPPRAAYPILVRITATSETPDESLLLARVVAEEIIERHERIFNEAVAPHLERQKKLEELYSRKEQQPIESVLRLERELEEVKSANTAPLTQKTIMFAAPYRSGATKPDTTRNTATSAILAFIIGVFLAIIYDHLKEIRTTVGQEKAPTENESENQDQVC
jgi:hypothetical protein